MSMEQDDIAHKILCVDADVTSLFILSTSLTRVFPPTRYEILRAKSFLIAHLYIEKFRGEIAAIVTDYFLDVDPNGTNNGIYVCNEGEQVDIPVRVLCCDYDSLGDADRRAVEMAQTRGIVSKCVERTLLHDGLIKYLQGALNGIGSVARIKT